MASAGNDAPAGFRRFYSDDPRFPISIVYPERYSKWYDSNFADHLYVDFHCGTDEGFSVVRNSSERARSHAVPKGNYSCHRPGDAGEWMATRQGLTDAEFKTVVGSIRWLG